MTPAHLGERAASWKLLLPNLLHDQKKIWLFPKSVALGHHLKPVIGIVAVTAALAVADAHDTQFFRRTPSFTGFNKALSGRNTTLGMMGFPLIFYLAGANRSDSYAQQTVLLAGEAVLDSEILTSVMKSIDRRLRPADVPRNLNLSDTWFRGHGPFLATRGSFPSGHTIAAFSLATVFADRYPKHSWVRYAAYGMAGMVGFSRVTLLSHFPSDVVAGAALGYSVAHFAVLRP